MKMQHKLSDNVIYQASVRQLAKCMFVPWEKLSNKSVLITGATGLIGAYLVDVLLERNRLGDGIRIIATSRHQECLRERFGDGVKGLSWNILTQSMPRVEEHIDFVVHLASNTHPVAYATDPIGTIEMNLWGTKQLLELSATSGARFVYASTVEVYGENRGDVERFDEHYNGYIDSNTLRAGYPESKRCGEALCQAYLRQKHVDVVIPRLARCYGPTLLKHDSKALSQFLRNALAHEDIILKSSGAQKFSYLYVSDAISALLMVMLKGATGEAYNLADVASEIRLRDLAFLIANKVGHKVVFQLPEKREAAGFSTATIACMANEKLQSLGWRPVYSLSQGIAETLSVLSEVWNA